jgi:hypothetical protein
MRCRVTHPVREGKGHPAATLSRVAPADSTAERVAARHEQSGRPLVQDFSSVRIHASGPASHAADVIGARALTVGRTIAFGAGEYRPHTEDGMRLLRHELAHVTQSGGNVSAGAFLFRRPVCRDGRLTREQYAEGIDWLEENAVITSEEAGRFREHIPDGRRRRCDVIEALERRAEVGRAGVARDARRRRRRGHLIRNFAVTPHTIHVDRGEAARISFDLNEGVTATAMIFKYEAEIPDNRMFFQHGGPRHRVAVWDGTFDGSRNQAPTPGTYRVNVMATDPDGNSEDAWDQIVVRNDTSSTVLPRTNSGLALTSLTFNGRTAVLTDASGRSIRAAAVSGLRPNNPHNSRRVDYTRPEFQRDAFSGPIPAGSYFIDGNSAQQPDIVRGQLRYPTGAGAGGWGPFRVPLRPADPTAVFGRSQFFFHLDTRDDGTAGCIGIASADEAKFNQMVAVIMRIPAGTSLRVTVAY